jgi:hypothetical protein
MKTINLMATCRSAFYSLFICCIAGGFLEEEGPDGHYHVASAGASAVADVAAGSIGNMNGALKLSSVKFATMNAPAHGVARRTFGLFRPAHPALPASFALLPRQGRAAGGPIPYPRIMSMPSGENAVELACVKRVS